MLIFLVVQIIQQAEILILDFNGFFSSLLDASFCEYFYGLERINSDRYEKSLDTNARLKSLFILIFQPYIATKLNSLYHSLYDRQPEVTSSKNGLRSSFSFLYLRIFPYFNAAIRLINFAFQMFYLFDKSVHHSVWLLLARTQLSSASHASDPSDGIHKSWRTRSVERISSIFTGLLFSAAFTLQFLEWYHSSDNDRKLSPSWMKVGPPAKVQLVCTHLKTFCDLGYVLVALSGPAARPISYWMWNLLTISIPPLDIVYCVLFPFLIASTVIAFIMPAILHFKCWRVGFKVLDHEYLGSHCS